MRHDAVFTRGHHVVREPEHAQEWQVMPAPFPAISGCRGLHGRWPRRRCRMEIKPASSIAPRANAAEDNRYQQHDNTTCAFPVGSFDRAAPSERQLEKLERKTPMSNVEQFAKAVTDAGAIAARIMRRRDGSERLVIQTPGGLITREVPLCGDFSEDVEAAATSAREIVASARYLTSPPARNLTSRTVFDRSGEPPTSLPNRSTRRP
jgi:hypothetical protein